jgi:hypothetical protein
MHRIYLLVQNDIRTGPFTLEELLQQSLDQHALVWIIGQSEDWLSPLEIPNLQPYYIKGDNGAITVKENVLADIQAKRFREPRNTEGVDPSRSGVLDAHLLEESFSTHSTTRHSSIIEQQVVQPKSNEAIPAATPITASSFTRSRSVASEPLVEKEEDNISFARKNWAVVGIAALLVLFVAWNALFNDGIKAKPKQPYAASTTVVSPAQPLTTNAASIEEEPLPVESDQSAPVATEVLPIIVPSYSADPKPSASTDAFLDSVHRVLDSQDQLMANVDEKYRKSFLYRKQYRPTKSATRPTIKNGSKDMLAKQASQVSKVPLSQQVDMQSRYILDRSKQLNSVEVMVKNNSKEVLKTVSVDVYYYKKGEKLLNKETVYFSNLHPRQSLTKSIAGNQRASSARFQLGTITTGRN